MCSCHTSCSLILGFFVLHLFKLGSSLTFYIFPFTFYIFPFIFLLIFLLLLGVCSSFSPALGFCLWRWLSHYHSKSGFFYFTSFIYVFIHSTLFFLTFTTTSSFPTPLQISISSLKTSSDSLFCFFYYIPSAWENGTAQKLFCRRHKKPLSPPFPSPNNGIRKALLPQQCRGSNSQKLQQGMKVSNAASPPQLEFLTHRSHCPSEMSKRELLRISSFLWVNKVRHDIQENPQVSKTKRDCVIPGQIWSKGKEEKAFGPCEERVVKGNFYFIVMLFQHNSILAFLGEKKTKNWKAK